MPPVRRIPVEAPERDDPRGWALAPVRAAEASEGSCWNLHVASVRPGAFRGNHAHPEATEWLLVFGGPARLTWKVLEGGEHGEVEITGGGPALFEIGPGVGHRIANAGSEDVYIMAFYDRATPQTVSCLEVDERPDMARGERNPWST